MASSSLITIVRNKFLEAIRTVNPPGRWKILVVDDHSQKLLGAVLKQFDILEESVTLIESVSKYRERQPDFEAMYLLMPTTQNVERIIRDFSGPQKQYAAGHLFFIDGLPEPLFQRLTSSPAEPFLRALKELFINFTPLESQLFSLNDPSYFFSMYSPPRTEGAYKPARARLEEDLDFAAKIIANLCITLNEFPYIRYYFPTTYLPLGPLKPVAQNRPPPPPETATRWRTNLARGSEARLYESAETEFVTKLLAFRVQGVLEEYKNMNPDFGKPDATRPRATLLITDRSMDMMAPFIHEFTYQAMANDLLPIEDGTKYSYKFQSVKGGVYEDKVATLSDNDNVWTAVRHLHMREAIDKLMLDFNKFLEDNAVFQGEGAASLTDMKEMLANLPQFQEQREKFSLHLNMAQDCMSIFETTKLSELANVEQCCSTGTTAEGKTPKGMVEEMVPLLDSRDVVNINKVRLIALYIQYRDGVPDEDRRRLYQHARLSLAEQDAVNSLVHFGVKVVRNPTDKESKKKNKQKPITGEEYELSRFKPAIQNVLEEQAADRLDTQSFPYVKESPASMPLSPKSPPPQTTSLRSQKPAWHRAPKAAITQETRQRLILFIAGGATYSEIREGYLLSNSLHKDIYIGSTHIVTPKGFVDDLKVIELGGAGSKAIPNGLRDMKDGPKTAQQLYDERYFVKDPPPPQPAAPAPARNLGPPRTQAPAMQPSPTNSYQGSVNSIPKDDKKKKRGFFKGW